MASENPRTEERYISIIDQYCATSVMHPLIEALKHKCDSQKLVAVINHEISAIRARSQDLDDNEITVAQKAFLNFMKPNFNAAMHIYVEEVLGIKFAPDAEKASIFESSIEVRAGLLEAKASGQNTVSTATAKPAAKVTNAHSQNFGSASPPAPAPDATLTRLENLLQDANKEYCDADADSYAQREAAKFLRNTIDNTVDYIGTLQTATHPAFVNEFYKAKIQSLRFLRNEASSQAMRGYNGKLRKFEQAREKRSGRPSLKRENAVLRSPGAPGRSAVNRIRPYTGGDRYRPAYSRRGNFG